MDWNKVVNELGPRLMCYFTAKYPKAQAADLVQEVLLRLVRRHQDGAIDVTRGSVVTFAFGIAKNVRLESIKHARAMPTLIEIGEASALLRAEGDPEKAVDEIETSALLRNAISALSDAEQQVVMLYMDEDLSLPKIGTILGMPTGTVKSHLYRAKQHLKKCLMLERQELR